MMVKDLIEMLQSYPASLPVLVSGYESGLTAHFMVSVKNVLPDPEHDQWTGEYRETEVVQHDNYALLIERDDR